MLYQNTRSRRNDTENGKDIVKRWREKRRMLSNRIESAKMESNYVEAEMVGKVDSLQVKW
jgi:hypothetical protein